MSWRIATTGTRILLLVALLLLPAASGAADIVAAVDNAADVGEDDGALVQKPAAYIRARPLAAEGHDLPLVPSFVAMDRRGAPEPTHIPMEKKVPQTHRGCQLMGNFLNKHGAAPDVLSVWEYICYTEDLRSRLQELKHGCLYLPGDKFFKHFFDSVERPHPWHFIYMLEDSFFQTPDNQPCPSELPGTNATTLGGSVVQACESDNGFVGTNGKCITATFLKGPEHTRVYQLEGLIGMLPTWEQQMAEHGHRSQVSQRRVDAVLLESRAREPLSEVRGARTVTIPLEYYICDPGDGSVDSAITDDMLQKQTEMLNRAHAGEDQCQGTLQYKIKYLDTGLRFTKAGIYRVTDKECASDCTNSNSRYHLTNQVVPKESGKIKVLFCTTDLLGLSSFPDYEDWERSLIINPGTVPGGWMDIYNHGDTLVHEMGHYLGLFHSFQGGCDEPGDEVEDTPKEESANFGCPTERHWRKTCSSQDPVHNFMDYSDDVCMCHFTEDQIERIWRLMKELMQDIYALAN